MRRTINGLLIVVLLFISALTLNLVFTSDILAITVGPNPDGSIDPHPGYSGTSASPGGWTIGSLNTRVEVVYATDGIQWVKQLQDTDGSEFTADDCPNCGQLLTIFQVYEYLVVGGDIAWTDWHEEILTAGWKWAHVSGAAAFITYPDRSSEWINSVASNNMLNFFFPSPLDPGTKLYISKYIGYVGADGQYGDTLGADVFTGTVLIAQYPTVSKMSEPSTMLLLGSGIFGFLAFRKKLRN